MPASASIYCRLACTNFELFPGRFEEVGGNTRRFLIFSFQTNFILQLHIGIYTIKQCIKYPLKLLYVLNVFCKFFIMPDIKRVDDLKKVVNIF